MIYLLTYYPIVITPSFSSIVQFGRASCSLAKFLISSTLIVFFSLDIVKCFCGQYRTRTCDSIHQPYTADTPLTLHWEFNVYLCIFGACSNSPTNYIDSVKWFHIRLYIYTLFSKSPSLFSQYILLPLESYSLFSQSP